MSTASRPAWRAAANTSGWSRTAPRSITPGYLHGSLTMLVTGIALVGLAYAQDFEPNNTKITVKLAVLLVIFGLVLANRKKDEISTGVWGAIGGLTIVNIVLAVFW